MSPTDPKTPKSPKEWTPEEKLRLLAAAEGVSGEELGALLRREGVHQAQLEEWRRAVAEALAKASKKTKNPDAARVKALERELARKEKALAEVTALLVLKKKAEALWGAEDDSTTEPSEK